MNIHILAFIFVTAIFIANPVDADTQVSGRLHDSARIRRIAAGDQPHLYGVRGQLYWVCWVTTGQPTEGCYLYRSRTGKASIITGDIKALSDMVNEEIEGIDKTKAFLRNDLPYVVPSLFGKMCDFVVDEPYIKMRGNLLPSEWHFEADENQKQRSQQILRKYISPALPTISADAWDWTLYVTGETGSVEKWVFAGDISPFKIKQWERTEVEKEGTIVPVTQRVVTLDPKLYD